MAKDIYHKIVRAALEKADWTITADPYKLGMVNRKPLEVDLAAEKIIAAEKDSQKIAVEVKSFLSDSFMRDWYTAVGQYLTYNQLIADKEVERLLFLAVPLEVYQNSFESDEDISKLCKVFNMRLLVFDHITIEIVKWIS